MIPVRGMSASMIVLGENNCAFVDAWMWDLMAWMDGWMEGWKDG
jgi:hypothetical protein